MRPCAHGHAPAPIRQGMALAERAQNYLAQGKKAMARKDLGTNPRRGLESSKACATSSLNWPLKERGHRRCQRYIRTGRRYPAKLLHAVVARLLGRDSWHHPAGKSIEKAHPSSGEADALLVSCAAERVSWPANRLRQMPDARKLRRKRSICNEFRRQFRFAGLTKPIGMALAVIPQVRFGVHGSLFPSTKT